MSAHVSPPTNGCFCCRPPARPEASPWPCYRNRIRGFLCVWVTLHGLLSCRLWPLRGSRTIPRLREGMWREKFLRECQIEAFLLLLKRMKTFSLKVTWYLCRNEQQKERKKEEKKREANPSSCFKRGSWAAWAGHEGIACARQRLIASESCLLWCRWR